jgi:hypothetical protein
MTAETFPWKQAGKVYTEFILLIVESCKINNYYDSDNMVRCQLINENGIGE